MVADYVSAVLADSPSAFWDFQDSGDFPADSSGNGKNLDTDDTTTGPGTTTYRSTVGAPSSAFCIALNKSVLAGATPVVLTATNNMTMEIWVASLALSSASNRNIFWIGALGTGGPDFAQNGWGIVCPSSGSANKGPQAAVSSGGTFTSSAASANSAWLSTPPAHVVIVRRSGTWECWVNGASSSIGSFTNAPGAPAGHPVFAYANATFTQTSRQSFAAVYPSALSGARIAAHYAAMWQLENADFEPFTLAMAGDAEYAEGAGVSIRP